MAKASVEDRAASWASEGGEGGKSLGNEDTAGFYDRFARDYDATVAAWGFEMPGRDVRALLAAAHGRSISPVLDCACGTGLVGEALAEQGGFERPVEAARAAAPVNGLELIGCDISQGMLDKCAATGRYHALWRLDMHKDKLARLEDGVLGALICTGAASYLEVSVVLPEWIRVLRPGGLLVMDAKTACWEVWEAGMNAAAGQLRRVQVSGPVSYLPGYDSDYARDVERAKIYVLEKL